MSTSNPVSFVKGTTVVYAVGCNMGGYSPDPDHVRVVATLDDARTILADLIDEFVDHEAESLDQGEVEEYQRAENETAWLWEGHAYADAAMTGIKPGSPVWGEWCNLNGQGVSVSLEDSRGYSQNYWINQSTIAETFGPTWHADLTSDYAPEELSDLINDLEGN